MQNQADTTATEAVQLTLQSFPKFDLDEFTTAEPRWTKYEKRFVCVAFLSITDDELKLALSLKYIGEESYDV